MAKLTIDRFGSTDEARDHYLERADETAEKARRRYITPGSGQSMSYEAKLDEARRHPDGDSFPWLEAEAEARDISVEDMADLVLKRRDEWEKAGANIEAAKARAKAAIRDADAPADMHRAIRRLKDDLDAI